MNKYVKRSLAIVLSMLMLLLMTSCGDIKQKETTKTGTKISAGEVWSAPSTVKIKQTDVDYAAKQDAALTYQAVRNEYESCQLVITAEKDIKHFELKASDLKSGDKVLTKDNAEIYVQKYLYYSEDTGNGYMPDPLLPMKTADDYEENTIEAGKNGAFWVTYYIPKDTAAGVYEGTFQLIVETEKKTEKVDIPVSVKVQDYTLTDEVTAKTVFSWRFNRVAAGELDGSTEMMETYYEFFKDYRISLQALPLETLSGEEYIEAVVKYYDEISTFSILAENGQIAAFLLRDDCTEIAKEELLKIAEYSTAEKNLFDKAVIYFIDEPDFEIEERRQEVIGYIEELNLILQSAVDTIKADNSETYAEFKKIENWESCILDIPNIITGIKFSWLIHNEQDAEAQRLLELINCICPQFHQVDGDMSFWEKYDIDVWWYGCMGPKPTAPTYHISDENLLSARTVSWLQSDYEVAGNLYWDAAAYTTDSYENPTFADLYEMPYRQFASGWPAGDGFLSFPGAPYGIYGPITTLRLMSIRDGMEEYEILENIKTILEEQEDLFDSSLVSDTVMSRFYEAIAYNAGHVYADGENGLDFSEVRSELLELVSGINEGLGFVLGKSVVRGAEAEVTYYVQEGTTVTIDGQKQEPASGRVYKYQMDLNKDTYIHVTVENADGATAVYDRFISEPVYTLCDLSDDSVMSSIKVTDGSEAKLVEDDTYSTDGTSVYLKVNGVVTGNMIADATFKPSVSIGTALFKEIKPSELSSMNVDVYNPGEKFNVTVKLYSGATYLEFGNFEIENGFNTLTLDLTQKFDNIDTADQLVFEFANVKSENTPATYEFYLDNIVGDK